MTFESGDWCSVDLFITGRLKKVLFENPCVVYSYCETVLSVASEITYQCFWMMFSVDSSYFYNIPVFHDRLFPQAVKKKKVQLET